MSSFLLGMSSQGRTDKAAPGRNWGPLLTVAASIVVLAVAWQLTATLWPSRAFPPPLDVLRVMVRETASGEIPYHLAITLCRCEVQRRRAAARGSRIRIRSRIEQRLDHCCVARATGQVERYLRRPKGVVHRRSTSSSGRGSSSGVPGAAWRQTMVIQ